MVIIIVLKFNLGVDLGPDPVQLTIEPGQYNDKSDYYYIFKTQLGD